MNTLAKWVLLQSVVRVDFVVLCLNSVIQGRIIIFQIKKQYNPQQVECSVVHPCKAAVNTVV